MDMLCDCMQLSMYFFSFFISITIEQTFNLFVAFFEQKMLPGAAETATRFRRALARRQRSGVTLHVFRSRHPNRVSITLTRRSQEEGMSQSKIKKTTLHYY
jgi:hypothetical protein